MSDHFTAGLILIGISIAVLLICTMQFGYRGLMNPIWLLTIFGTVLIIADYYEHRNLNSDRPRVFKGADE